MKTKVIGVASKHATFAKVSRLATVSDGTNSATYSYLANSSLVGQIVFASNTVTQMTTSKQYDYLNRLSSISSTPTNSFIYEYNAANQRTLDRLWDGSYWDYGYDPLGQVIFGSKFWVDQTPVAGQQFDYTFDTIGNRTQTEAGGDQNGANLRVAGYTNNILNQITSRGVPAAVDVMGDGLATNGVTVNGLTAYRKVEYFRQQLSVTNTSPVWESVTVIGSGQTNTGHLYVPQAPETNTYDADGNLLTDGRWTNSWDAENRLLSMTSLSTAPSGSQLQLAFTYDYMGRRIQKLVSTNNGTYFGEYTNKYAYDAWNCLAILNPSLVLSNSFLWGSDLSGSLQGAGGVGGLIKVSYYGAAMTNCFVAYDGNGNVSALVNAANGATLANYDYGPFGEVIRLSGPMAKLNPFRFSTKYDDDETDFLYYGYRYYNASTGRWLSRDTATEPNLRSLYGMVHNDPIDKLDVLGLDDWQGPPAPIPPINPNWPVDSYNCAGCAFRVCQYMSKPDTLARLAKCSATDKSSRCSCGLRKCHYYDITGWQITDPNGNVTTKKANDFHIDCGDEDGGQCTSKNGPNPPIGGNDINSHPAGPSNPIPPGYKVKAIYTDKYYCCKP